MKNYFWGLKMSWRSSLYFINWVLVCTIKAFFVLFPFLGKGCHLLQWEFLRSNFWFSKSKCFSINLLIWSFLFLLDNLLQVLKYCSVFRCCAGSLSRMRNVFWKNNSLGSWGERLHQEFRSQVCSFRVCWALPKTRYLDTKKDVWGWLGTTGNWGFYRYLLTSSFCSGLTFCGEGIRNQQTSLSC